MSSHCRATTTPTAAASKNSGLTSHSSAKPKTSTHIDGLVIPGGESSTFLKLLGDETLEKLTSSSTPSRPLGLAPEQSCWPRQVENPHQPGLNAIDITIQAQCLRTADRFHDCRSCYRARRLRWRWCLFARLESNEVGDGVEVLAKRGDDPVLVRKGSVMAATFHPELSADTRVHAEFLKLVKNGTK